MTQTHKKPSEKSASAAAGKATKHAFATVESTRQSAENVVKIGSSAMRDLIANGTGEAQKAHEKALAIGRESAENFAKSADAISKVMNEMIGMSKDNVETLVECTDMTASLAKDIGSEVFENANQAFSDTVETSKEFFACRTINDMVELQNRLITQSMDNFFSQTMKLSDRLFEYSTQALEPINERVTTATEKFSKVIAA